MQRISTLLDKYSDQSASEAELEELLILLEQSEGHLYNQWKSDVEAALYQKNEAVKYFDKQKNKALLLQKMDTKVVAFEVAFQKGITIFNWRRNLAVAACVGLILMAVLFFWNSKAARNVDLVQLENITGADSFYAVSGQRYIVLRDSSEVLLYEGSSLQHGAEYNQGERKLVLKGKARFTVRKNHHKPFIVYTSLNVTTALGTIFEVSETPDSSTVELLEGSVKVQGLYATNAFSRLLQPGQKAVTSNGQTIVSAMHLINPAEKGLRRKQAGSKDPVTGLAFKQAALEKVLKVLEDQFRIRIQFDQEELSGMLFTGSFNETDSVETILNIIGSINNLKIITSDRGFTVKK